MRRRDLRQVLRDNRRGVRSNVGWSGGEWRYRAAGSTIMLGPMVVDQRFTARGARRKARRLERARAQIAAGPPPGEIL